MGKYAGDIEGYLAGTDYFADYPFMNNGRSSEIPYIDLYLQGKLDYKVLVFHSQVSYVLYSKANNKQTPDILSLAVIRYFNLYQIQQEGMSLEFMIVRHQRNW